MLTKFQKKNLDKLIKDFNFSGSKKFKLVVVFGLLGDFDSFEYAINLKNFINNNQKKDIDIFAIAIGNEIGRKNFVLLQDFLIRI